MKARIPFLPLLLLSLLLASCAGKQSQPADPALASQRWQSFATAKEPAAVPFRDALSMRFGKEGDTRRVTAIIWGNADRSLRLDVQAGVGATVAMIAQKDRNFLFYAPMDQKAYFYEGNRSPLIKVGVPLPFDLFQLEALLNGRWTSVFGKSFIRADQTKDNIAYTLDGGIGGELVLGPDARPVAWSNTDWRLGIELDETGLVHRIDLSSIRKDKGVVIVKERANPGRFTDEQLKLSVPENTALLPLDRFRARH